MKKFTSLMAAALAVSFGANAQLVGEDVTSLIVNPSFESETLLEGWTASGTAAERWSIRIEPKVMPNNSDGAQYVWVTEDGALDPANFCEQWISSDKGEGTYVLTVSANVSRNSWRGDIDAWSKPSATYPITWSRGFIFIDDGTADDYTNSLHPGATRISECGQGKDGAGDGNAKAPQYMGEVQGVDEDGAPMVDEEGNPVMIPGLVKGGMKEFHAFLTTDASDLVIGFGIPNDPTEPVDPEDLSIDTDEEAGTWKISESNANYDCITSIPKGSMRFDNVRLEFFPTTDTDAVKAFIADRDAATSGVEGVEVVAPVENNKIYNLQGIEVKEAVAPGIYIQNGKKFIVK